MYTTVQMAERRRTTTVATAGVLLLPLTLCAIGAYQGLLGAGDSEPEIYSDPNFPPGSMLGTTPLDLELQATQPFDVAPITAESGSCLVIDKGENAFRKWLELGKPEQIELRKTNGSITSHNNENLPSLVHPGDKICVPGIINDEVIVDGNDDLRCLTIEKGETAYSKWQALGQPPQVELRKPFGDISLHDDGSLPSLVHPGDRICVPENFIDGKGNLPLQFEGKRAGRLENRYGYTGENKLQNTFVQGKSGVVFRS